MQKIDLSFQENNPTSVSKFISNISQLPEIATSIEIMRKADEEFTRASIKVNDIMKEQILVMAGNLENTYRDAGIAITQISTDIGHILLNANLEKYVSLTYSVLEEKYKNASKDRYKKQQQKVLSSKIDDNYRIIELIDLDLLDDEALERIYHRSIEITDKAQRILNSRNRPILDNNTTTNTLTYISENEGFKFKKAEMGKPLVTVEQMTAEDEYKQSFEELKNTLDRFVKATTEIRDWFCVKYIPISTESCRKLNKAFEMFLEFWRPYFDKKYRMDHVTGYKAAISKVTKSSAAAAKETAVQTLWISIKKEIRYFAV